jgi:hypothetical protein
MKKLILILIMFVSIISYSQTINTTAASMVHNNTIAGNIELRMDKFEIKENLIIWTDFQKSQTTIYFIENIFEAENNVYYIYCNTNGNKILFTVSFIRNIVYVDDNLIFFNLTKL